MRRTTIAAASLLLAACGSDVPAPQRLLLAATHTIEDSGLLEPLVAAFAAAHPELILQVSVSGSGHALAIARNGDADVVLTHSPDDERTFIEDGYGLTRRVVMESDFVLLGPTDDPAAVGGVRDIGEAFRRIVASGATFISRGDESGTHRKEQAIWQDIDIVASGPGYVEAGVGMADALRVADQRRAYILSDRPTFSMLRQSLDLVIVSEGDDRLLNPYAVMIVRDAANAEGARTFVDWITGPDAQTLIGDYGVDASGHGLVTATASPDVMSSSL